MTFSNFARWAAWAVAVTLTVSTSAARADTLVRMNIYHGSEVSATLQLYNSVAPGTVRNFLRYVNNDLYDVTIIHRDAKSWNGTQYVPFVVQGGGYWPEVNAQNQIVALNHVETFDPIVNEFQRSNIRGTIAMAKTSDPNSATSEWFVNMNNNAASLDNPQNSGGFTVFGEVVGNGMAVFDAIDALARYNLNPYFYPYYNPSYPTQGPFSEVPLTAGYSLVIITSVDVIPYEWKGGNAAGATNWGLSANWNPATTGVPQGAGSKALFGTQNAAYSNVGLDADRVLGGIVFSAATSTTLQGTNRKLTLDNDSFAATIDVAGTHTLAVPLLLNSDAVFTGPGTLTLAGGVANGANGAKGLSVASGKIIAPSAALGSLTVAAGAKFSLQPAAGGLSSGAPTAVPEPSVVLLLLAAGGSLPVISRRFRRPQSKDV